MQPGLSSYTYTWAVGVPGSIPAKPLTAFDLVDKVSLAGFKLVQIADNLPLENWSENQLSDLRIYAGRKDISIEMGGRGLTPEHTIKCLNTAKTLHSPVLRMVIDGAGFEPDSDSVVSIIKELIPEFESRKIRLAIENHDRFKAREFKKIIQSVDSEWVGICLDSVNSMGAGEGFETVSEILLPFTLNLHLKDFSIRRVSHKMGLVIEGKPAGQGMLNIAELVKKLSRLHRCESAILELWTPPKDSLDETVNKEERWAAESILFLKQLFNQIEQ